MLHYYVDIDNQLYIWELMEIMDPISWIPVAAYLLIICFSFSIFYLPSLTKILRMKMGSTNGSRSLLQTPPGNAGLPFIGETLNLNLNGKRGVPERFILDRIKKYSSNVFRTSLIGQQMVVLGSPEGNKFLFSNENKVVKAWWPPHMEKLFTVASLKDGDLGETALRLHRSLSHYLKPDALRRYVPIMDSATKQHLQAHWEGKDVVTVLPLAEDYTFSVAFRLFLGMEDEETMSRLRKPFEQIEAAVRSLPLNIPGTKFNRGVKARAMCEKEIKVLIRQWKSDFSEGRISGSRLALADVLQQAFDEEDEVIMSANILASLLAAFGSTSSTLASIIMYMAQLPRVYNQVFAEQKEIARSKGPQDMLNWEDIQRMKYSWNVVCEVLRLHPPLPGTYREAISNFTFDGFFIPKGWKLHWSAYSTHRNSKYFENPDHFDPSRFEENAPISYSYVPFGGGPRMCPGREYAKIKLLIFMHNVVTKFRWEKIFSDEKIICDPFVKPSKGLPIRLFAHN